MQDATTANLVRQFDDSQPFNTLTAQAAASVRSQPLGNQRLQSSQNTIGSLGPAGSASFYGGRLASGTGLNASQRQIN